MKWKGRRQSTNVQDVTLDPLPEIPDGAPMLYEEQPWKNTPQTESNRKTENVRRNLEQRGDNVPTPTPRPKGPKDNGSHDNLVTPGKWNTKTK